MPLKLCERKNYQHGGSENWRLGLFVESQAPCFSFSFSDMINLAASRRDCYVLFRREGAARL